MADLHILPLRGRELPLRGHDLPPMRLYVRARVFRLYGGAWTWQHRCDYSVTTVSPVLYPSQALALQRARGHVRRCA